MPFSKAHDSIKIDKVLGVLEKVRTKTNVTLKRMLSVVEAENHASGDYYVTRAIRQTYCSTLLFNIALERKGTVTLIEEEI